MSLEDIKFSFVENEDGFTVNLKGDKERLRAKLEAFEAFLNFREKAKEAGFTHPGSDSPIHQFFKAIHKHHAHYGGGMHGHCHHGQHRHHGHDEAPSKNEAAASQGEDKKSCE